MKKRLAILLIYAFGLTTFAYGATLPIITAPQGGTGIGSATTTDIGKVVTVQSSSPFRYTLSPSAGGSFSTTTINGIASTSFNFLAGTGLSVASSSNNITYTNTGVTSLAGTANQVNVSNSTGTITLSTPQDIAQTSSPTFATTTVNALKISGFSPTNPQIYADNDTNTGVHFSGPDVMMLMTGGNEVLNINAAGKVGISTTTPQSDLTVAGTTTITQAAIIASLNGIVAGLNGLLRTLNVVAPLLYSTTTNNLEIDFGSNANQLNSGDILLPRVAGSDQSTVSDFFQMYSAGRFSGGTISDAGGSTINVSAGYGTIATGTAATDTLVFLSWTASSSIAIPATSTRHIGIEYNAGSPRIAMHATDDWTYQDSFPLGWVVRDNGTLHITNNARSSADAPGQLIRRFHQTLPFVRDELVGGLILGETGTRNLTMSTGYLWDRNNRFLIPAVNTSVSDNFTSYYRDATTGFKALYTQTQWDNDRYDNGSGTLVSLTAAKYANHFWYLEPDGQLIMMYGRAEYSTAAAASAGPVPATLPNRLSAGSRLIARTTFQKGGASYVAIDSAFTNTFTPSSVTNHANLSNLDYANAGHTGFQPTITFPIAYASTTPAVITASSSIQVSTTTTGYNIGAKNYPIQFIIENPTATENDAIFIFNATSTITKVTAVNKSQGDTVTFGLGYSTSRATATSSLSNLFSSAQTVTATTTPVTLTINGSSTPGTNNPLIFWTTAASSTQFTLTGYYNEQ